MMSEGNASMNDDTITAKYEKRRQAVYAALYEARRGLDERRKTALDKVESIEAVDNIVWQFKRELSVIESYCTNII